MNKAFALIILLVASCAAAGCVVAKGGAIPETSYREGIVYTEQDLERYLDKWRIKDGLAGSMISDYFCEFLIINPELFLAVMERNRDVFDAWSEDLQNLSFVDYGGCMNLECLHGMMVSVLERTDGKLADELLLRLQNIEIRAID